MLRTQSGSERSAMETELQQALTKVLLPLTVLLFLCCDVCICDGVCFRVSPRVQDLY